MLIYLMLVPLLLLSFLGMMDVHVLAWASLWALALGLGLHIKNTNRKNFMCCGPWPFLLLMPSLNACWDDPSSITSLVIFMYFLFSSCSPGAKEFVHEISRLANNIVSLFMLVGEWRGEANLFLVNLGRWYMWILETRHVWKEDFGMKYFVKILLKGENL